MVARHRFPHAASGSHQSRSRPASTAITEPKCLCGAAWPVASSRTGPSMSGTHTVFGPIEPSEAIANVFWLARDSPYANATIVRVRADVLLVAAHLSLRRRTHVRSHPTSAMSPSRWEQEVISSRRVGSTCSGYLNQPTSLQRTCEKGGDRIDRRRPILVRNDHVKALAWSDASPVERYSSATGCRARGLPTPTPSRSGRSSHRPRAS